MAKLSPQVFFDTYADAAMNSQNDSGVPASITLAQAAIESGWGGSTLTKEANNFFGIKDFENDDWHGENYAISTQEYGNSGYYSYVAPFRKYKSPKESFDDHAYFLKKNKRYNKLFSLPITDYKGWANGLKSAGYATDPSYANKLINMIQQYDLYKYDQDAPKKKTYKLIFICVLTTGLSVAFSYYKGWFKGARNVSFTILIGILIGIISYSVTEQINKNKNTI